MIVNYLCWRRRRKMNSNLVALTYEEIKDVCMALIVARRGNSNEEAVSSFKSISDKMKSYLSKQDCGVITLMEQIEGV